MYLNYYFFQSSGGFGGAGNYQYVIPLPIGVTINTPSLVAMNSLFTSGIHQETSFRCTVLTFDHDNFMFSRL